MDKSLFEDVPYDDSGAEDSHLFEDVPHPDMKVPDVGAGRSALVGAGQGATFGFADELTAPVVAAAGMAADTGNIPGESTWDKYQRLMQTYRDVARDEQGLAQEQHPTAYLGGAVTGGVASMKVPLGVGATASKLPGSAKLAETGAGMMEAAPTMTKIAKGATEGGAMAGAYGAGESTGGVEERLAGAKEAVGPGMLVGAAIPSTMAVIKTIKGVGTAAGEMPIIADMSANAKRGFEGENLITSVGRRKSADLTRKAGSEFFDEIKALKEDIGSKIGNEIDSATEAGTTIDLTDDVKTVLERLKVIQSEGSKESAAYAKSVESEIKKVLGIKPPKIAEDASHIDLPEGLTPEALVSKAEEIPESIIVSPKKAQDLKQVLSDYRPQKGMAPQELDPARAARELSGQTGEALTGATDNLGVYNAEYGKIKDAIKRLGVNEKNLPGKIKDQIFSLLSDLEKENKTGDVVRERIKDVLNNIREINPNAPGGLNGPQIADKYKAVFDDLSTRLILAGKNIRGGESHGAIGTTRAVLTSGANLAGLVAGKIPGARTIAPVIDKAVSNTTSFAKAVIESPSAQNAMVANEVEDEPYRLQRKVATASESADPEVIKQQAQNIRQQYGKQGEQLATILDNMADQSKDSRRALMFTVLQNPVHRKMLGLSEEKR